MRIAILTPACQEFLSGYSLTGIMKDQVTMLQRGGCEVEVWVNEQFHGAVPEGMTIKKLIPFSHLIDYHLLDEINNPVLADGGKIVNPRTGEDVDNPQHLALANQVADILMDNLKEVDYVFSHDWIFLGWQLPYYLGLLKAARSKKLDHIRWFHWVHSVPGHGFDWWRIEDLGRLHKVVYPNRSDRQRVAEAFKGRWENVRTIPHIKDIRVLRRFTKEAWDIIDKYPNILQADVVQIYPASVDRLEHKRVREVILIFKEIKRMGFSVCLVIANQWATTKTQKEDVEKYRQIGLQNGLGFGELVFTSELGPEYEVGVPHDVLTDLMACANLFIFPTISESFGLVLPEAILAGTVLPVLNADLDVLSEITGGRGLRFKFGSYDSKLAYGEGGEKGYLSAVAAAIVGRMGDEESVSAYSVVRQKLNMDALFFRCYAPLLEESASW